MNDGPYAVTQFRARIFLFRRAKTVGQSACGTGLHVTPEDSHQIKNCATAVILLDTTAGPCSPVLRLLPATRNQSANPTEKKNVRREHHENATRARAKSHFRGPINPPPSFLLSTPGPLHERRHGGGAPRRWDEAAGRGGGGGGAPVAAALRALRTPADHPPVVPGGRGGGGGEAAGAAAAPRDAGGRGVHAPGRVHGADALRLRHLHAGLLPHALGPRPRLRLPLRRLRHQPPRDREGHLRLAHGRLLAHGGISMAYIFQTFIHVDVKPSTK